MALRICSHVNLLALIMTMRISINYLLVAICILVGENAFAVRNNEMPPVGQQVSLEKAETMKTIGLIGGITWVSSIEYYRLMNQLVQKKLGGVSSAKVLMYSIEFGEFSKEEKLAQDGNFDALAHTMVDAASRLKAGRADFVVIASNTMNSTADQIEREVDIPVLQIADAVGKAVKRAGINKVLLLGTKFTMEAPFYKGYLEKNFGIEVVIPPLDERDYINKVIFEDLAAERFTPQAKQRFIEITEAAVRQTGAEGVILGCTEIPLLINQQDISVKVFDTLQIHAEAAVNRALDIKD